ncbi:MAG: DegT/DnrJ/EryC1/StrS aminotransferase family protein [Pseudodesulfovibrio sp.]|nr:DegT/DnrJ/EryC1/StrS aminotransferase family protein [Pseudodesulfovibrio sp.]
MFHILRQLDKNHKSSEKVRRDIRSYLPPCEDSCFASTGRSLVSLLIRRLGLTAEDTCLIPAYVPEGLIRPLRESGIQVQFYTVDDKLFANLDDLNRQIENDPSIRLLVLIHPFGFEQPVRPIKELLSERNIAILEDCAQSLFGTSIEGPPLGMGGDFSLFSLNKFLPVPDGAILQSNNPNMLITADDFVEGQTEQQASILAYEDHLHLNHELLQARTPDTAQGFLEKTGHAYERYYTFVNRDLRLFLPSLTTKKRLKQIDFNTFIAKRISNTRLLYAELKQTTFKFVYENWTENYIPMTVPVYVAPEHRDEIIAKLFSQNILLSTLIDKWNYIPPDREEIFQAEARFINSHLLLPINEFLSPSHMETIINALNKV